MVSSYIQTIQRQVAIGRQVTFWLKNGRDVTGVLIELGTDHVTLENEGRIITIVAEMIGGWDADQNPAGMPGEKAAAVTNPPEKSEAPETAEGALEPLKKLVEIEARFEAKSNALSVELSAPDFVLPVGEKARFNASVEKVWNRIKSRFEYAAKINELSAKFGRIQPMINDLESLDGRLSDSAFVKRHLAYLYWLSGKHDRAFECYQKAAVLSDFEWDWFNTAVIAFGAGDKELACYCLGRFFRHHTIDDMRDVWHFFVTLSHEYRNYPALQSLVNLPDRSFSDSEQHLLFETGVYLLKGNRKADAAMDLVERWVRGDPLEDLILDAFDLLEGEPDSDFRQATACVDNPPREEPPAAPPEVSQHYGYIFSYRPDRNFGFLKGISGTSYFFHRSAIKDEALRDRIKDFKKGDRVDVVFEATLGPKGPLAIELTADYTVDELFSLANQYASEGEYGKAIAQIKRVLESDSDYPKAQELHEKWRGYARVSGVPKGSNPYARAKRAWLIRKDLDSAAKYYRQAIYEKDNLPSSVKDYATLLDQMGKPAEAIDLLIDMRDRIGDSKSVDNMLIGFYQNAGQHDKAIDLLKVRSEAATTVKGRIHPLWQIANNYLRQQDYDSAEDYFRKVLDLQPGNKAARRNVAICLFKREQYDEAGKILNNIMNESPDDKTAELLEAIDKARSTGQSDGVDRIIIETSLMDLPNEISGLIQFYLDRCEYVGVRPDRVKKECFDRTDINLLEELATKSGRIRPRDRAGYYLSAAKIVSLLEEENPNNFYKYLGRSFASWGDAAVIENKPLESIRELYREALQIYGGYRSSKIEKDAENALVRFLYSILGSTEIPIERKMPSIDRALDDVISRHPQREKVFDCIAMLFLRSQFAAKQLLHRLYKRSSLQSMSKGYIKGRGIEVENIKTLDNFVCLWNELSRQDLNTYRSIVYELKYLKGVELTIMALEHALRRIEVIRSLPSLDLDRQRITQLQKVFETALELCKQPSFEERERLCIDIDNRCAELLHEVESSPTKLSIEEIHPVITGVKDRVEDWLDELYRSSTPLLELRLPYEECSPDDDRRIEVQVVVSNGIGCSPADSLELVIQENEDLIVLDSPGAKQIGSLRGGEQRIITKSIRVGEKALHAQTFSLPVYAQYRTRTEEVKSTLIHNFSIRLYSHEEFKEISNYYAAYAEGGVVSDSKMFFGRETLIENAAKAILASRQQAKCIVVFGQKRAGKSSILHHLGKRLKASDNLLVVDLGNIATSLDEYSKVPFTHLFLRDIIGRLEYAVEDRIEAGFDPIEIDFPNSDDFYAHPSPLMMFKEFFIGFKRTVQRNAQWRNVRVVLLIDEFSYIFEQIVKGNIGEVFMKNWKALLQENFFSAVLVGQDVMPKFKQRYPNEFGTTQDERVSYLRREDAIKLIDEPIRIGGRQGQSRYREQAIQRIINLTAGSPFYIQIICSRLVDYMNNKRARLVTEADIDQVKDELIHGVNAFGLDKFDNLISPGDLSDDAISEEDILSVLTAIAMNSKTGPCNINSIACETKADIAHILDDLTKREVIKRDRGQYYSIRVGLFREWLAANR